MQLILDFSLSDSRVALEKALGGMKSELTFEIAEAVSQYELNKQKETGKPHYLVEADGVTETTISYITDRLRNILQHPHRIPFLCYESIEEILALIQSGFESASLALDEISTINLNEVYVSIPRECDEASNTFEMVGLSELFDQPNIDKMEDIILKTQKQVIQICRNELAYNLECMQKATSL
ncbi:hypothetical protein BIZ78_gp056 [Erwinia phage vB_EamM_Caitlin]|uniref:hypothetical protein n=1 Tax=Erwinia phage vB_EamM_Caitlin TaxID=1883379 RepID=UPI00081C3A17|nr:hypothetical protein BIZ78_gp056 [Erwinia phage vB_EamM_Caitlin]ANZ48519.1 hypothetical protein CAITLIN_224 [Erwinia phage vB_EamM_Caitlin]